MRVIAGKLGGRLFAAPGSHATHPMSDRVRGGLFNILGDITGLTVLDAFAGSGALAFEAVSRSAKGVVCIEPDRVAQAIIAENITKLHLTNTVQLIKATAGAWLGTNPDAQFDIVLCDPPYGHLHETLLEQLTSCVHEKGIFVVSWPGKQTIPVFPSFRLHTQRSYGDAQLLFFVR